MWERAGSLEIIGCLAEELGWWTPLGHCISNTPCVSVNKPEKAIVGHGPHAAHHCPIYGIMKLCEVFCTS